MSHRHDRSLRVAGLARVEGEGAMYVHVSDGTVTDVRLDIYEPPRFFEALLRGRRHTEAPDITARICGICPVAYQVTACRAIEDACGVRVPPGIARLRRLLYCGEWISSHALHVYLLHAPDFLGYPGVVELARDHPAVVARGLALKKAGNAVLELIGGRAIHPINVRVGGFYQAPPVADLTALARTALRRALDDAMATVEWVAGFDFPDFRVDHELLALVDGERYPIDGGTPHSSAGVTFPVPAFEENVIEEQVGHSTALHAHLAGRGGYLTGPMARYTLNHAWLGTHARQAAGLAGLDGPTGPQERAVRCDNPFRSIVVRAVEVVYAVEEALALIDAYEPPRPAYVDVPPRAGVGHAATEAPRGLLYHRYRLDADGIIRSARIVPPTSQNQASVERDLRRYAQANLDLDDDLLTAACEQAIRNYDPCISCATHFLTLNVERT